MDETFCLESAVQLSTEFYGATYGNEHSWSIHFDILSKSPSVLNDCTISTNYIGVVHAVSACT